MPLNDYKCPKHGMMELSYVTRDCPKAGCNHTLEWIPCSPRISGKGWFKEGYDEGLGIYVEDVGQRKAEMKRQGVIEAG
jgi:hypothetical protein